MQWSVILAATALAIAGTMVGIELAVALVHHSLRRLPDPVHAPVAAELARVFGGLMPIWYAATLVVTIAVAVMFPWGSGSWMVVGSAIAWAATIILAAVILAPINNRIAAWREDALPEDWLAQRRRWDRLHLLRLSLLIAGWTALVLGILLLSRNAG